MSLSNRLRRLRGKAETEEKRPWLLKYRSNTWFIWAVCTTAIFTDIFLYAVIVPVIPFALQQRAHVPADKVQSWVSVLIAVYGASLAVFSPICGYLADRLFTRRTAMVLGLIALALATILLNLGSSIALLITGRILQGLSAAVVWVVGLALLADSVKPERVAEMMGHLFIGLSAGFLLGPLLGGVVFAHAGYNWVFGMTYILIGADIGMRLLVIEKSTAKKWLDAERATGAALETGQQVKTSVESGKEDSVELDDLEIGPSPTAQQPSEEKATPQLTSPLKPSKLPAVITLLRSRRLLTSLFATISLSTLMTQFDAVLPIHVRNTFGWNSLGSGLIFIPLVLPSFFAGPIGAYVDRHGGRWVATLGFVLCTPFEILLRFVDHNSLRQKVLLCSLLAMIGVCMDFVICPVMGEIQRVVIVKEEERPGLFGRRGAYAQAYGLFNFAWASGCLIGPIWAGYVNENSGWGTMTWTFGLLSFLSAIPIWLWTEGWYFDTRKRDRERERRKRDTMIPPVATTVQ